LSIVLSEVGRCDATRDQVRDGRSTVVNGRRSGDIAFGIVDGSGREPRGDGRERRGETLLILAQMIELVWSRDDRTGFVYWVSFSSTTLFLGTK